MLRELWLICFSRTVWATVAQRQNIHQIKPNTSKDIVKGCC